MSFYNTVDRKQGEMTVRQAGMYRGYEGLDSYLGGRGGAYICNNTGIYRGLERKIEVSLHHKRIMVFYTTGYVLLDSCGFKTTTTKARMNTFLKHLRVYSRDFDWFVGDTPFDDGMVVLDKE